VEQHQIHPGGEDEPVSWETFRERFLSEYLPNSIRYDKEVEFLQLTQGGKTVAEYAERFKHLSRFYTLPLDEEWRCRKFENGLRGDIRLMVAPLSIKDFVALVEKARVMEKMKREVEGQRPQQPQPPQRIGGPSGSRPRHEERRRPYDRPHHQPQESRSFSPQQGRVRCYTCGGPHSRYACPRREGYRRCNNCGKEGHFGRDCPNLARTATRPPVRTPHQHQGRDRGNRPQATGKVYAMTGAEVVGSGNLIMGYCVIYGMRCCVLYDSGATQSCVLGELPVSSRLGETDSLGRDLQVSPLVHLEQPCFSNQPNIQSVLMHQIERLNHTSSNQCKHRPKRLETKNSNFPYLEKLSEDPYYVTTSTTAPRMHYRAALRVEQNQTGVVSQDSYNRSRKGYKMELART